MAASRSSRLRARSSARAGLRQATSRSPGKSGELISARSCSSNSASCSGPSSAISFLIAGARSAVIHPYFPSSSRMASMRAVVIMPRSPTITILRSPNSPCTTSRISVNAAGSAVFPSKHPDRDRPALGVGEQPVLDLHLALLAVAGVAARPERAARALQPRAGQVEQRHPRRVRGRGQVPAGEPAPRSRPAGLASQSIAAYASSVVASSMPRSAPSVESPHQARVDSFEPGVTTREMIRARARSRCRPAGPSSAGRPSLRAIACTAATCPCGSDRAMRDRRLAGRDEGLAFQRGLDRVHDVVRHLRQVRQRLVPDFPAVAVGAAQQPRLVLGARGPACRCASS